MKKLIILLSMFTAMHMSMSAQTVYLPEDSLICSSKFQVSVNKGLAVLPLNDVIAEVGKTFLGVDYVAHSLETSGDEQLVLNLRGVDCTTFLENALVLSRCIKMNRISWEDYKAELTKVRYRDGIIDHYPSRLHYFSDWIFNNSGKGIVKDVTKEIGGTPVRFNVNIMSRNPDKYKQLDGNGEYLKKILSQEKEISARDYYYIPKSQIKDIESKIGNGYLIAITTNIEGADIAHVGIAVKMKDGRIHFMHAPLAGAKVQITEKPIDEYLAKNSKQTGIVVLKPLEP